MSLRSTLLVTSAALSVLALPSAQSQSPASPPASSVEAVKPALDAGPVDPKAQKTYQEALDLEAHHKYSFALDSFKKADKQDGNHCPACAHKVMKLAIATGDLKLADAAAQELIGLATTPDQQANAHVERAQLLMAVGRMKKKPDCFADGEHEAASALAVKPGDPAALYVQGMCLAHQEQDEAAKKIFATLLPKLPPHSVDHDRVARYLDRPELVRARMTPPFSVRTLDGRRVSMDELRDKVVLIDFWATWCGPCQEALPHVRRIAKQFEGQPLVVLSVSLDTDEQKWKDFVSHNEMTWAQYRDGGFDGTLAQLFGVHSIPHTFTIDSDGVLQDEHIGDGNIEGKLKKLVAQAQQRNEAMKASQVASATAVSAAP